MNRRPHDADRLLLIFSDIEMGGGGPQDDFPHTAFLGELILRYNEPPYADVPIELVFNGDTFDLLKTPYMGAYPRHIGRDVALAKMASISAAHPRFFEALRRFLQHDGAPRSIHFTIGNHDPEIIFPEVQQLIKSLCGDPSRVHFDGFELEFGKVHIEHGGQLDNVFRMDPDKLLVDFDGDEVLNISWGAVALLDTVMPLHKLLAFHERVKPKKRVLELVPEVKELLMSKFLQYWTRDYWHGYFGRGDPTKKLSWSMVKETVWRLSSQEPEVAMNHVWQKRITSSDGMRLYVVGHQHQQGLWSFGDRKVMQAGCLRDEYMLFDDGEAYRPIPKSYVEVYMRGELPAVSHFVEVEGPARPAEEMPQSIFDVLPQVRELLETNPERERDRRAEAELDAKDAPHAAQRN